MIDLFVASNREWNFERQVKKKPMKRKVLISLLIPDFYSQKAKET